MSAGELPRIATDPGVSVWVSANAGAGKTHVLTDRVTRLLLDGAYPARILCLTYTKAAAAEMAGSVVRAAGRVGAASRRYAEREVDGDRCGCARCRRAAPRAPAVRAGAGDAGRVEDPDHPFVLPDGAVALSRRSRRAAALHGAGRTQRRRADARGASRGAGARGRRRGAADAMPSRCWRRARQDATLRRNPRSRDRASRTDCGD